jgi:hypothetical protein
MIRHRLEWEQGYPLNRSGVLRHGRFDPAAKTGLSDVMSNSKKTQIENDQEICVW